jgi:hypothetical protein
MKKSVVGFIALLSLTGCNRDLSHIEECIKGSPTPVSLEQAIATVKAAGLQVSSQIDPNTGPTSASANRAVDTNRLNLLCQTDVEGQRLTVVLHIDMNSRTVNGLAAHVTEDEVKWTSGTTATSGRPTLEHHTLNRLNGDYRSYQDGALYAAPPPTYHCSSAPAATF